MALAATTFASETAAQVGPAQIEDAQPVTAEPSEPSRPVLSPSRIPFLEVRLTLSEAAANLLSQRRFRRFLSIELEDAGHVAVVAQGPLGDHVAHVWIDLPEANRVLIQTRVGRWPVAARTVPLREGLRADVAARLVAIATSEMVRAQARPLRARKRRPPRPPTRPQIEMATRDNPALLFSGKLTGAWLPSMAATLGGSTLELSFRSAKARQFLAGSWLAGTSDGGPLRWVEIGLGADRSFWMSPTWRFDLGLGAYAASLHMRDVAFAEDHGRDSWSARATGRVKLERALGGPAWLGLALEPGFVLRPASFEMANGEPGQAEGLFLGLALSVQFEQRFSSSPLVPVSL